jgi:hypothetical protein
VGPAAERPQGALGLGLVAGLAVDAPVERDQRVDAEHEVALDREGLAAGVLARNLDRVALLDLLDAGGPDGEGDPELLEDRPPLRRRRREDERGR